MTDSAQPDPTDQEMQSAVEIFSSGRYAEAVTIAQALTIKFPRHPFGWKLLGFATGQLGKYPEAVDALRVAVSMSPQDVEVNINLGAFLVQMGLGQEAIEHCQRALSVDHNCAAAHNNLAAALRLLGRYEEALLSFRLTLEIKPDLAEAHYGMGNALYYLGRPDEAYACHCRALELRPDYHEAAFNVSQQLLAKGKYREAWPYYELRYRGIADYNVPASKLPFPQWRGESLKGKSLLLWPEQGFGDYIQFIRYASLLKERGVSRLTIRCPAPLKHLLATAAGVDDVITDADPVPPHDYWSFLLSLPLHFDTTVESIPASLPYLRSLPDRRELWRERLPATGFKVGIVWKGSSGHSNDGHRSLPALDGLRPMWSIPGISFVSLQKGAGEDEARGTELPIVDLGSDIRDFADTAAIVDQLDLVICVDTAIAHVAGALGKPCWVLLPAIGCDWRWMRDRDDSPWYPGALRLFRQKERGDWSSVVDEVATALRAVLQSMKDK